MVITRSLLVGRGGACGKRPKGTLAPGEDRPGNEPKAALLCLFSKEARNLGFYVKLPNFKILAHMPLKTTASQNYVLASSVWPGGHPLSSPLPSHCALRSRAASFSSEQPSSNWFRLCRPEVLKEAIAYINHWVWSCTNKTLFMDAEM